MSRPDASPPSHRSALPPFPARIAHRGAGQQAPENTLGAFRWGARHGYRAFECDVRLSADGVPFLLHDDTLERTTDGHGPAGDRLWADLARLDAGAWHSAAYAGEPLLSLDRLLDEAARQGWSLNLEIKPSPGTSEATGDAIARRVALQSRQGRIPIVLSSFNVQALAAARTAAPEVPRALLLKALPVDWLDQARALGCAAVVLHHPLVSAETVDRLHAAGLQAWAYTVNEATDWARVRAAGLDAAITDAVDCWAGDSSRL